MKVRTVKSLAAHRLAAGLALNLGRPNVGVRVSAADPTRTVTERRDASARIRRKFAVIRGRVRTLVLKEDAFGLGGPNIVLLPAENTFCATGPGGGVDPHCSPGEKGFTGLDSKATADRLRATGIESLATGNCWVMAAAQFEELKKAGKSPVILDWGGHVEAALRNEGGGYVAYTASGPQPVTKEGIKAGVLRILATKKSPLRIHESAQQMIDSVKTGSITAANYEKVLKPNFEKAADVVGASWTLNSTTRNVGRFAFDSTPEQVTQFEEWIRELFDKELLDADSEKLWAEFARRGFLKGAGRAFDDFNSSEAASLIMDEEGASYLHAGKKRFLRGAFGRPETREKLQLLASRSFSDLKGVTEGIAGELRRVLTDGLSRGENPRALASLLDQKLDLGSKRAETIARTEIIRAHAEGQLDAFERLGVDEVGVAVEFQTAGDLRVCRRCSSLSGAILSVQEAHGVIPVHPMCRCAFLPANVGESRKGQVRGKKKIGQRAAEAEVDLDLEDERPQSGIPAATNRLRDLLAFDWALNHLPGKHPQKSHGRTATGAGPGTPQSATELHMAAGVTSHLKKHVADFGNAKYSDLLLKQIEVMNPNGIKNGTLLVPKVYGSPAADAKQQAQLAALAKVMPAGTVIQTKAVTAKKLGLVGPPAPAPAATPTPPPSKSTIPYQKETVWATGDRSGAGGVLNGIPFAPAPPKFWEHTKDVDVGEPKPTSPVTRALCMVREPDGRVWVVEPTGHFGNRKNTVPGGTVEAGLSLQQNALKETFEETGLQVKIIGHLGDIKDSNNGRNGRLYLAERVGGAPWDAKIEKSIIDPKTGQPAAESSHVKLVTPEHAATLLHRTDDLAMLATVAPVDVKSKAHGETMKKIVDGVEPAAQAWARVERAAGRNPGSPVLHAIQELRGFNGTPTVVSKKDMDSLVAKGGHIEMLRGVKNPGGPMTAKDAAEQFKTGTHFPGFGCFGNGTYADSNKGYINAAGQYGAGGDTIRIALPKTAKVIKFSELEQLTPVHPSNFSANGGGHSSADQWRGMHAALAGYDAIHVDGQSKAHGSYGKGFYVILNRSALIVQKESAKGHVI